MRSRQYKIPLVLRLRTLLSGQHAVLPDQGTSALVREQGMVLRDGGLPVEARRRQLRGDERMDHDHRGRGRGTTVTGRLVGLWGGEQQACALPQLRVCSRHHADQALIPHRHRRRKGRLMMEVPDSLRGVHQHVFLLVNVHDGRSGGRGLCLVIRRRHDILRIMKRRVDLCIQRASTELVRRQSIARFDGQRRRANDVDHGTETSFGWGTFCTGCGCTGEDDGCAIE